MVMAWPVPMDPAFRRILFETAETLAFALAGGLTFIFLGLPAGLVSGSVLAVASAALLGRPMRLPLPLARVCYVVVGTLLGTVVTPETLRGVATWPASIVLLMLASLGMIAATMTYLRVVHRWDPLSALMGASPGSMAQVIALSSELGGDLRAVAIVQTVRVLLLVVGLPNALALFGLVVPAVPIPRGPAGFSVLGEMILLLAVAVAFAVVFMRLRFPGGLLFGALAGSAILHGSGLVHAALPWWIGSASVVTLGALVGSRFANTSARMLLAHLGAAFGSFAVSMAVATVFILIVTRLLSFPIANVVIAFAPGAQDTMMVLALALHLDPVYVGAHHLARFLVVTLAVAVAARRVAPKQTSEPAPHRGVVQTEEEVHSAASARSLNGNPSRCQTSTKASASASVKPSS
jgi:membrane AbrB-like protein